MENRKLLIDTSIIIDHLRKINKRKSILFSIKEDYDLYISVITIFELFSGANSENKFNEVEEIISIFNVIDFDYKISQFSAELFKKLKENNKLIEIRDLFIGATALYNEIELLTINKKHFERLDGIKLKFLSK